MFDGLDGLFAAWRTALHIAEWTGLGIGALIGIAVIAYFAWPIAWVRRLIEAAVVVVVTNYCTAIYVADVTRDDVMTQWRRANELAEDERIARDARIAASVEDEYGPIVTQLQNEKGALERQAGDYEKQILAKIAAGRSCKLGVGALRLRLTPGSRGNAGP